MIEVEIKTQHLLIIPIIFFCFYNVYQQKSFIQYCTLVDKLNKFSFESKNIEFDFDEMSICNLIQFNYYKSHLTKYYLNYLHEIFVFSNFSLIDLDMLELGEFSFNKQSDDFYLKNFKGKEDIIINVDNSNTGNQVSNILTEKNLQFHSSNNNNYNEYSDHFNKVVVNKIYNYQTDYSVSFSNLNIIYLVFEDLKLNIQELYLMMYFYYKLVISQIVIFALFLYFLVFYLPKIVIEIVSYFTRKFLYVIMIIIIIENSVFILYGTNLNFLNNIIRLINILNVSEVKQTFFSLLKTAFVNPV